MTERYELRDEHGRTSGYVLREAPHRATYSHSGPRTSEPSPIAVAICLAFGAAMLVTTLADCRQMPASDPAMSSA